ncbi:Uncharacterised protein [Vibrio cholerae]|nr:Uncharacterised protein [Vibrio cholerae]
MRRVKPSQIWMKAICALPRSTYLTTSTRRLVVMLTNMGITVAPTIWLNLKCSKPRL